jgi:hypothetical protein
MAQDYNNGLSSFITKLFDCSYVEEDFTKTNLSSKNTLSDVENPLLSIIGVSNERGYFDNQPKNFLQTGYYARHSHFIGTRRSIIVPMPGKLNPSIFNTLKSILSLISVEALKLINQGRKFDFKFNDDVEAMWEEKYYELKKMLNANPNNPTNPSIDRDYKSVFKLAGIFELVLRAHDIVRNGKSRESLLSDPGISNLAYCLAAEWVDYFVKVDQYLFDRYINKKIENYETLTVKLVELLKRYPEGRLWSDLKRELGLHRTRDQSQIFDGIIAELKKEGSIEIIRGKGNIVKLREHLLS